MIEFDIATSTALKKILGKLVSSAKGPIKKKISAFLDKRHINDYLKYANNIDRVKTIYEPEIFCKLSEIYHPLKVSQGALSFIPDNVDSIFEEESAVLVEGTAGQGKSLFMRYLCFSEMKRGEYLPFIIMLRYYGEKDSLLDLIYKEYTDSGFNGDIRTFVYFLIKGKMVFFLDGYDEVHPDLKSKVAREIEALVKRYGQAKFVVSSRPEASLELSYFISTVKLNKLEKEEQKNIIKRIVRDNEKKKILVDAVENREFISEVVNIPLLLILLLVAYKAESRVPETLVKFYCLIFPTMLYRHDDTKLGYQRKRLSLLGRYEIQELFDALSFISLKDSKSRFSGMEYNQLIQSAAKTLGESYKRSEVDNIRHDITKVTCLVVEDGYEEFSYIHKSIQEFHASPYT